MLSVDPTLPSTYVLRLRYVNFISASTIICDLTVHSITPNQEWRHLKDIQLADPDCDKPGRIDNLLGIETFLAVWTPQLTCTL